MTNLTMTGFGISANDLAARAGFSRSTAKRFLEALERHTRIGIHFTTWERLCAVLGEEAMNAFAHLLRLTDNGPGAGVSHDSTVSKHTKENLCTGCNYITLPGACGCQ